MNDFRGPNGRSRGRPPGPATKLDPGPLPPLPEPSGAIWNCYTNAEWRYARNHALPGAVIVVADREVRRAARRGLLYRVTPDGLRGPEYVRRATHLSEWIPDAPRTR